MNTPKEFGRQISLQVAEKIIDEHTELDTKVVKGIDPGIKPDELSRVKKFLSRENNAFVFSKKLITRFFEPGSDANYLLVIVGAHPEDEPDPNFPPGSFTVVTMGCVGEVASEGELSLSAIESLGANEYPKSIAMKDLDKMAELDSPNLIYKVI